MPIGQPKTTKMASQHWSQNDEARKELRYSSLSEYSSQLANSHQRELQKGLFLGEKS
jgi:hypothetical protein